MCHAQNPIPAKLLPPCISTDYSIAACINTRLKVAEPESIASQDATKLYQLVNPIMDVDTSKLLEYWQLLHHPKFKDALNLSAVSKFSCLVQNVKSHIKGTSTIEFINKDKIPQDRLFVCNVLTKKKEQNRT